MTSPAPTVPLRQGGLSLVELAVALAALGLMTWAMASSYGNAGNQREQAIAQAHGQQLREAVRTFALNHARLPCPDTNGNGWEGDLNGSCPAGTEIGWLPYHALGLDLPDDRLRAAYGVYRNTAGTASVNADLAVQAERSSPADVAGDPNYMNVRDLIIGLGLAATQTPAKTHVYLTGDGGPQGTIDCSGNLLFHPAFVIIIPLQDSDADGTRFDGVHAGLPDSGHCLQAPATPRAYNNDDFVIADGFNALAGWLAIRTP